jgi:hypothetical protein
MLLNKAMALFFSTIFFWKKLFNKNAINSNFSFFFGLIRAYPWRYFREWRYFRAFTVFTKVIGSNLKNVNVKVAGPLFRLVQGARDRQRNRLGGDGRSFLFGLLPNIEISLFQNAFHCLLKKGENNLCSLRFITSKSNLPSLLVPSAGCGP